jgi:predicted RNase H-like HicB family nuclease
MKKNIKVTNKSFPVLIEKDERGFYIAECPLFTGCFTQGKSIEKVLIEIQEVIKLCIEEKENRTIAETYDSKDISFHNITVALAQ